MVNEYIDKSYCSFFFYIFQSLDFFLCHYNRFLIKCLLISLINQCECLSSLHIYQVLQYMKWISKTRLGVIALLFLNPIALKNYLVQPCGLVFCLKVSDHQCLVVLLCVYYKVVITCSVSQVNTGEDVCF